MDILKASKDRLIEIGGVIEESIRHLCMADHQGDATNIDTWLTARSQCELEELFFHADSQGFICVDADAVIGVAHITADGELTLCYVAPTHAGKGIGSRLLAAIELQARNWGLEEITLTSTATAKSFYESHGFQQYAADTIPCFGMPGHPLRKLLSTMETESGIATD